MLLRAHLRLALLAGLLATVATAGRAQTTVTDAWIRGTAAQQKTTGMFARITSSKGGRLLSAASAAAGVVEIHEMTMDGNVMRMRALSQGLELPAGKVVELRPGSYHIMLMDLKQPLQAGDTVPVSLLVLGADGQKETLELKVPVRPLGAMPARAEERKH